MTLIFLCVLSKKYSLRKLDSMNDALLIYGWTTNYINSGKPMRYRKERESNSSRNNNNKRINNNRHQPLFAGCLTQHFIDATFLTTYHQQGTTNPLLKSIFAKQQQLVTTGICNNLKKRHTPKILKMLDIAYDNVCTI